ncbi:hypothetical protein [Anoxybacillus sp. CHMUD]|nr:hypothetical protein [Anoxybacillus sp. CHMUD]
MIKIPAEKLANAVIKHLLPGLIRHLSEQKKEVTEHKNNQEFKE